MTIRMWMIPPYLLCDKHLLGEHGELHKHRHVFDKKQSITGRIFPEVQIEPQAMALRHDELAAEMLERRMNHQSPYTQPDLSYLPEQERTAKVNITNSLHILVNRCEGCRTKITGGY